MSANRANDEHHELDAAASHRESNESDLQSPITSFELSVDMRKLNHHHHHHHGTLVKKISTYHIST